MDNTNELPNIINDLGDQPAETSAGEAASGAPAEETGSLEELRSQLAAKTEEAQGFQDKYLRLAAEFENYKKLALRDQRDHVRFANERLLKELLPVIDNLERAIHSGKTNTSGEALVQGVELTLKHALETMEKFGVRQIPSVGEPFDPACHQAVTRVESDTVPENSVVDEFQRGYYLHDRVLRAAMVSVATPATVTESKRTGPSTHTDEEQTTTSQEPPSGGQD
jgi:molecular chaperone GrpE